MPFRTAHFRALRGLNAAIRALNLQGSSALAEIARLTKIIKQRRGTGPLGSERREVTRGHSAGTQREQARHDRTLEWETLYRARCQFDGAQEARRRTLELILVCQIDLPVELTDRLPAYLTSAPKLLVADADH